MAAPIYGRFIHGKKTIYSIIKWRHFFRTYAQNLGAEKRGFQVKLPDKSIEFSVGEIARLTDGSAVAQYGDTSVLVTAVSKRSSGNTDFMPLVVDYRQKSAAAGRIPTNHFRRDRGPSEKDILTSRMIDRSIRPLFPAGFMDEVQVNCNLLSVDGVNDPDVLSINAASTALMLSDIPWEGPVAAVRVGLVDNNFIVNPTRHQKQKSSLDLVLASSSDLVVMVEASGDCIPEKVFMDAVLIGMKYNLSICSAIRKFARKDGKPKRDFYTESNIVPDEVIELVSSISLDGIMQIFNNFETSKLERGKATSKLRNEVLDEVEKKFPACTRTSVGKVFDEFYKLSFRNLILETGLRNDGRNHDELRPIQCNVDLYKPLHGSAIFQRGQTQVFCTVTFDSPQSVYQMDVMQQIISGVKEKNFMLHYEFPPYATNDIEKGNSPSSSRREIGHGALAEKALRPVVPKEYPYTIRLTSEVLESAGSSSMASVCGGSLALMDAGVPILEPVAGVAMGMVSKPEPHTLTKSSNRVILTDIQGLEDYIGDMDFKIAGTMNGITAVQADIKLKGIPKAVVAQAIQQGAKAYKKILDIMKTTIAEPNKSHKDCGPVIETIEIPPHKRAYVIGIGGANIRKIKYKTGITFDHIADDKYQVYAPNKEAMQEALHMLDDSMGEMDTFTLENGAIYTGKITEIRDSGVMVQLHPSLRPEFVSNFQLDVKKVDHPFALNLHEGSEITVRYFGRDPVTGKARLSRKALQITSQRARNFMKNVDNGNN